MIFIGSWDCPESGMNKKISPAAVNKMDYIINISKKLSIETKIISTAKNNESNNFSFFKKKRINGIIVYYLPNYTGKHLYFKRFFNFLFKAYFVLIFMKNTKKNEIVYFYHSCDTMRHLKFLKQLHKIRILLDVEEIYGNVKNDKKHIKEEFDSFEFADYYIFPTNSLNLLVNSSSKPFIIIHGSYILPPTFENIFDDNKIHIVYSGTLDSTKGGAENAVRLANYLDDRYVIHILGFGSKEEVECIEKCINVCNGSNECKVIYEGLKTGNEYFQFLQSCNLGLATQTIDGEFNETSFPSKILTYLSNGIRVVSSDIDVVRNSDVSQILYYYKNNSITELSKIIKKINFKSMYDSKKLINSLDNKAQLDLKRLLNR